MEGGFGARVAELRRQRGLSQRDLARLVGRSESWVSQVERGVLPVGRLNVLEKLADALAVTMFDLDAVGLAPPPDAPVPPDRAPVESLDHLRAALVGHPHLAALVAGEEPPRRTASDPALTTRVGEAWAAAHDWRIDDLGAGLAALVPDLEEAARGDAPDALRLLARGYRAAAAAFTMAGEPGPAWVAAERAMRAAEAAGDPLGVVAGQYRLAAAFVADGRFEPADRALAAAIAAVEDRNHAASDATTGADPGADGAATAASRRAAALAGALHLLAAAAAAAEGERRVAHDHLEAAGARAEGLGARPGDAAAAAAGADDDTGFGPTEVAVTAVAVAVDLGDAGMAIDLAGRIDRATLPRGRQARLLADLARAHTQRRQVEAATEALLEADVLAPALVAFDAGVREAVRHLVALAGDDAGEGLGALAHRTAAFPP